MALIVFYPVLTDIPGYVGELCDPSHRRSDPVDLKAGTLTAAVCTDDVEEYQRREWIGEPIEWLRPRPALSADIAAEIRAAVNADPKLHGKFDDVLNARMRPGADPSRDDPRLKLLDVVVELAKVRAKNAERKAVRDKEHAEREAEHRWRSELKAQRAAGKSAG